MTSNLINFVYDYTKNTTGENTSWGSTFLSEPLTYTFFPKPIEDEFGDAISKLWKTLDKPMIMDNAKLPKMNVFDGEKGLVMQAVIPFTKKEDVKVTLDPLTNGVKIEVDAHQDEDKKTYHLNEISRTSFKRTFALDKRYNVKKASANFEDAILTIEIPFADDAEQVTLKL